MVYQDLPPVKTEAVYVQNQYKAQLGTTDYIIHKGDTLYGIARKFNTTIDILLKFNFVENQRLIYSGQKLIIPMSPPESIIYTVKKGDTLSSIARKYKTSVKNLVNFNYLTNTKIIHPGQKLVVNPSLKG